MDDIIQRLHQKIGPRRQDDDPPPGEAQPIHGEARQAPSQRSFQLTLPMHNPWSWRVLLAIDIAVFVVPLLLDTLGVLIPATLTDGRSGLAPVSLLLADLGAKNNAAIYLNGQFYRFLTSMFLHGGILHIAFNAFALYSLGPETERIYGTPRFLALYFIAGIAGGAASYAFSPNNSVGASGAIFGLVGGLAAFYYSSRRVLGEMARQQLGGLITIVMINLFIGFSTPNIDNFAHIGGLLGGAAVGWFLAPRFEIDSRLYPPVMVRRGLSLAWVGAIGVLALVVIAILVVNPPI